MGSVDIRISIYIYIYINLPPAASAACWSCFKLHDNSPRSLQLTLNIYTSFNTITTAQGKPDDNSPLLSYLPPPSSLSPSPTDAPRAIQLFGFLDTPFGFDPRSFAVDFFFGS